MTAVLRDHTPHTRHARYTKHEVKFDRATPPHVCAYTVSGFLGARGDPRGLGTRGAWAARAPRARGRPGPQARGTCSRHAGDRARGDARRCDPRDPADCVARGARIYSIDTLTHKRCLCQRIPASVEVVGRCGRHTLHRRWEAARRGELSIVRGRVGVVGCGERGSGAAARVDGPSEVVPVHLLHSYGCFGTVHRLRRPHGPHMCHGGLPLTQ